MLLKKIYHRTGIFYLFLLLCLPLTQSCIPILIAAAAGGGYLVANEDAQKGLKSWLEDLGGKHKSSRVGDSRSAEKAVDYKKGSGVVMVVHSFSVVPTDVERGKIIIVKNRYSIAGARKKGVTVVDRKVLWYGKTMVTELDSQSFTRTNGTWESSSSFKIPESAELGEYKISQSITCDDSNIESMDYFTVKE